MAVSEISPPIMTDKVPAVAFNYDQSEKTRSMGESEEVSPSIRSCGGVAVASGYRVRRFTPREVERLFGFPDDYTLIPRKNGKLAADTPRYAALGNSIAVTALEWLGKRIETTTEISE